MSKRLCYACCPAAIVDDAKALACHREFCTARSDVERETKPQGTRPPQHNEPQSAEPGGLTFVWIGDIQGGGVGGSGGGGNGRPVDITGGTGGTGRA